MARFANTAKAVAGGFWKGAKGVKKWADDHIFSDKVGDVIVGGAKGIGRLAAGTASEAGVVGLAAAEGTRRAWNFLTDTKELVDSTSGNVLMRYPVFKKGALGLLAPAALAFGLARGGGSALSKGELKSSLGYVTTGTMHNMIDPVEKSPVDRDIRMKPNDFGATGELVFAMHRLRNGGERR